MISKPILFSGPMVRAILEGRKTQTRRTVKPQPAYSCRFEINGGKDRALHVATEPETGRMLFVLVRGDKADTFVMSPHPVGSEMWVRETWTQDGRGGQMANGEDAVYYRADMPDPAPWKGYWKPSIFMPRWASRLTLTVKDVRVERLQDISEEDAIAEGILEDGAGFAGFQGASWQRNPEDAYRNLWESINGPGSWDANPWVFAYTFERKA